MVNAVLQAEAGWLNGDTTIAGLLAPAGVLPYIREPPPAGARVCWLFRNRQEEAREANQLKRLTHYLQLRIKWPLSAAGANVADLQAAADTLVDALVLRIRATGTDKTHGGFFSWVGESVGGIGNTGVTVAYLDAEQAIRLGIPLQIDLTYTAVTGSITG